MILRNGGIWKRRIKNFVCGNLTLDYAMPDKLEKSS